MLLLSYDDGYVCVHVKRERERDRESETATLRSHTNIGENCPSSDAELLPPEALTRICFVI